MGLTRSLSAFPHAVPKARAPDRVISHLQRLNSGGGVGSMSAAAQLAAHKKKCAVLRVAAEREAAEEAARRKAAGELASYGVVDVAIRQRIEFSRGVVTVEDASVPALLAVAESMVRNSRLTVGVEAHATRDAGLAQARVDSVVEWLASLGGIEPGRLRVVDSGALAAADEPPGGGWHVRFHVIPEISIWDRVEFGVDSTELDERAYPIIQAVARIIAEQSISTLCIEGHCCLDAPEGLGPAEAAEHQMQLLSLLQRQQAEDAETPSGAPVLYTLSLRRAAAVARYLTSHCGVAATVAPEAKVVGFGIGKPVATCESAEGRATNRRVQFLVM